MASLRGTIQVNYISDSIRRIPFYSNLTLFHNFEFRVVERDGTEYFVELMPALHNYITVDTKAFLEDPNRLLAVCSVIKKVLVDDSAEVGEDAESHAAKLIEVLILQCRHHIQNVIPSLLQLALERLSKSIKTSELRTMCLQVSCSYQSYHIISFYLSIYLYEFQLINQNLPISRWSLLHFTTT